MPMIKIDDKEYDSDTLSDDAKGQFQSLKYVDAEINRLSSQINVFKTARLAYARALNQALQAPSKTLLEQKIAGDTIKLS